MRTLLIDNYDSFTYNLFHLFASVDGKEPDVIRNDDPGWTMEKLREYEAVVISPGPGRPQRKKDFGICTDVIRNCRLPLLGVCLGHQGLCYLEGADVVPMPEVCHGRNSEVLHTGVDVLAGVPSPFSVVRYHSLMATALPESIEPIAWTVDGILMAVRHRRRPAWGLQFHPESICTEFGSQIVANFLDLARKRHKLESSDSTRRSFSILSVRPENNREPGASRSGEKAAGESSIQVEQWKVCFRKVNLDLSPEVVFDVLYGKSEDAFWLDSSRAEPEMGRFSFMGDASGPLAKIVKADVFTGEILVQSQKGLEVERGSFFEWLDADMQTRMVEIPELPFEFALGWVGYLGYELKAECGGDRIHKSNYPDAAMIFADRALAFDHREKSIYLLALADPRNEEPSLEWFNEMERRLSVLTEFMPHSMPLPSKPQVTEGLHLRHGRDRYCELIAACQQAIQEGETYEVCLTNMITGQADVDSWACYRLLRRLSPVPFAAYLNFRGFSVLSSSPERFLRVSRDRMVESKPIKGTRPRSLDADEDERLRADLSSNVKDRAENLMIVDLVRNDLGRCAEVGSVHVPRFCAVETYATVHHLVSTVRARLRGDSSAVRCARAAFPGGSMTGAPKIRSMQIIDQMEAGPRGVYSGALGYFSLSGAADLSMVIRTLIVSAETGSISYGVGGALLAMSDPAVEFEETAVKALPLLRLFEESFPRLPTGDGDGLPGRQPERERGPGRIERASD